LHVVSERVTDGRRTLSGRLEGESVRSRRVGIRYLSDRPPI